MAEGISNVESKILCRYFVHGACKHGDNCKFSHDRRDRMDNVCKYYLSGYCSFADRCRYDHVKPKTSNTNQKKPHSANHCPSLPPLKDTTPVSSGMVSLKKALHGESSTPKTPKPPEQWVLATEFVPGKPYLCSSIPSSYANAASTGSHQTEDRGNDEVTDSSQLLCPFSTNKECPYGEDCVYLHGNICDLCGLAVLAPDNEEQNQQHKKVCLEEHERNMELSFAVAYSKEKQCGICMDTVLEKEPPSERRFGIMSDCTHCFCLACIRKWRASKQFDSKTIRSCPECRTQSDFVTPSAFWVDKKEEKVKLIDGYKTALSKKPCKYFDEGRGECPFNDRCFYLHMLPDGTIAPPQPRRRRRRHNANGELDLEEHISLWDFLQERRDRLENLLLEFFEDDLATLLISLNFSTDSDEDSDDEYW